jgi:hypothetical protein
MSESSMAPLPHVVIPQPDEPVMGMMTRLLEANSYNYLTWLSDASDLRRQHHHVVASRPESHPGFNQRSRLNSDAFSRMAYHPAGNGRVRYFDIEIRKELVAVRHRKACPVCLQASAYHRAIWDLTPVTVCHEHGIRLLDRCLGCSKPLGWGSDRVTRCVCGSDLRLAPRVVMADEYVAPVRAVAARLGRRSDGDSLNNVLFGTLDGGELLWLMLNLGGFVAGARGLTTRRMILRHADDVHLSLATGYRALVGWPMSFDRYLEAVVNPGTQRRAGTVGLNVQQMVHWLAETDVWPDVMDAIRDAFLRHMQKR